MRTIGFRSNILFAIAAAFGVIAALGQPWYGPRAEATDAQMEDLFGGIGRAFAESGGTSGWEALQTADQLLAGLAVGTVALLILALVPALLWHVGPLARWSALAALGVVVVKLFDTPTAASMNEPRSGLLVALCAAGVLVASAMTVATAPVRRTPVKTYTPPPAPAHRTDRSFGPPQF